ncbi:MAG TPA: Uma2 family endonuclease [Armatimonadota bacterium]|nr:Uma2 family endonuclease [Armatimonadota bacterium]
MTMINAISQYSHISEEEYYSLEARAEIRHEYLNGEVFAMAGGSPEHARLIASITGSMVSRLRGHRCYATSSEQRIKVERTGLITYPDVAIVCPPERYDPVDPDTLLNPRVVVEVLSPTTEEYDRTGKYDHYRQIESLTHYILVSQDQVRVECFNRGVGGEWTQDLHLTRDSTLRLLDLELEVPLAEIYDRLSLPGA